MKRSEMINKMVDCYQECVNMNYSLEKAMDRVLELIEEEGMIPPNTCERKECNRHADDSSCGNVWNDEDEFPCGAV